MYRLLRRGAQHLLVALTLVSADEFWSFWCQFIGLFQVYASVYDTSDRHRSPTMCTATSTWLVAALPVGPAGPAGVFGHLGVRRVAWPPLLRICLTFYYISLFWLLSPPSGTVVLVIVLKMLLLLLMMMIFYVIWMA